MFPFLSHFAKERFMLYHIAFAKIIIKIDTFFWFTFFNVHLKIAFEFISNFDVEK